MPDLILLAGLPGAGKSTFAKTLLDLKYSTVSSDAIRQRLAGSLPKAHAQDIRPWDVFYTEIEDRLRCSIDTLADATFLTRKHRERALAVAAKTGAQTHLILFKNPAEAFERNAARDGDAHVPTHAMAGLTGLYYDTLAQIIQESYASVTKIESFCA